MGRERYRSAFEHDITAAHLLFIELIEEGARLHLGGREGEGKVRVTGTGEGERGKVRGRRGGGEGGGEG